MDTNAQTHGHPPGTSPPILCQSGFLSNHSLGSELNGSSSVCLDAEGRNSGACSSPLFSEMKPPAQTSEPLRMLGWRRLPARHRLQSAGPLILLCPHDCTTKRSEVRLCQSPPTPISLFYDPSPHSLPHKVRPYPICLPPARDSPHEVCHHPPLRSCAGSTKTVQHSENKGTQVRPRGQPGILDSRRACE